MAFQDCVSSPFPLKMIGLQLGLLEAMPRKTHAEVLLQLRREIDGARYLPGSRLPPERELAETLGCSRQTLRTCLEDLEVEGLIWRHVGQGTFLGRRPLVRPIRDTVLVEAASPGDLMTARLLLEPQVAAAAAERASAEDIAFLRDKVQAGRQAKDRAACELADDSFHSAIARVAANPVLIGFLTFLSGARRRAAWQREWERTYRQLGEDEFRIEHSGQHGEIVEAIAAKDPAAARAAMESHLQTICRAILRTNAGLDSKAS